MVTMLRMVHTSALRLLLGLLFLPLGAIAQTWDYPLSNTTKPNFYQIQADFNRHWAGKKPGKGSGWKVFKRWEWFWEQRINPDGTFPDADANANAWQAYLDSHPLAAQRGAAPQWKSLGPNYSDGGYRGTGRVNCVAVDPRNASIMWAGTPGGGLWKSENGGENWVPKTDGKASLGVSAIAFHPLNPDIMYIGTGDGDGSDTFSLGVWQSTDGGETWKPTGLQWSTNQQRTIRALVISPKDPLRLYCGANDGIYYTTNGGQSWSKVLNSNSAVSDIEIRPDNPEVLYACTNGAIHRSKNGGLNWQTVKSVQDAGRIALCVSPADPEFVGALCSASGSNGFLSFLASSDGGQTFVERSTSPNILGWSTDGDGDGGQGWYDLCVAASPLDANEIYTGGVNIWKSVDGGYTWNAASHWYFSPEVPEVHADHHNLLFGPDGALYNVNDGGVYKTDDHGASFAVLTGDLVISQMYRIGIAQQNQAVIAGLQDNGTKFYNRQGMWSDVLGGDGMECIIDPSNPQIMYGSLYYGSFHRSKDGGRDWNGISQDLPDGSGAWITPIILNPLNPKQIWTGYQDLWRSNDQGDTWEKVSEDLRSGTLLFLAMGTSDTTRLYAATSSSIYRSENSGKNWTSISNGLPFGTISRIAVHPDNADEVYITISGYQPNTKVVRSRDGGKTWENFSGTLPNIPANCIAFHQNGKKGMYVGMDVGVYYRDSTMEDWVRYTEGLPNTPITDLEIRTAANQLVAATYGRGVWMVETLDASKIECASLEGFKVLDSTFTTVLFQWDALPSSWGYQYRYRKVGATDWILSNSLSETKALQSGLTPGTQYEIQVRAQCQGKNGDWGASHLVTTQTMEGLYCSSFGSATAQWIDSLSIANMRNASGNNGGYGFFNDTIRLTAGETYPVAVFAKANGSPTTMFWRAWLDLNGDQDFDDAGELIFQRATSNPPEFSRNFTVPATAQSGTSRFRISMGTSTNATPCFTTAQTRDVEDYPVLVAPAPSVSTKQPNPVLEFVLRPNPASEKVMLQLPNGEYAFQWQILGTDGKAYSVVQQVAKGKRAVEIPVGQLPAGLYWIRIQDETGNSNQKYFVKI